MSVEHEYYEEQFIDKETDAVIDRLSKMIEQEESRTACINIAKMQKFISTYKDIKNLTDGTKGAKLSYKLNEPFKSVGYISVVCKKISFVNYELFLKAINSADNFEIYPKTNGTLQMNFTFHGLTSPIE